MIKRKTKNKIVVLGKSGLIGSWVYKTFKDYGYKTIGTTYQGLNNKKNCLVNIDISNYSQLERFVNLEKPDTIVNCVGVVGKDLCAANKEESEKANLLGVKNLANLCKENQTRLIHFSTIVVHNGRKPISYTEEDKPTRRIGDLYNRQKSEAEHFVGQVPNSTIIRLGDIYGHKEGDISSLGGESFRVIFNLLKQNKDFQVYRGIKTNKTLVSDLGGLVLNLFERDYKGIINVGGDTIENYDFVKKMKETFNLPGRITQVTSPSDYPGHKLLDLSKMKSLGIKLNSIDEGFKILSKVL